MCDCLQKRVNEFKKMNWGTDIINPDKKYELLVTVSWELFKKREPNQGPNPAVLPWMTGAPNFCPECGEKLEKIRLDI